MTRNASRLLLPALCAFALFLCLTPARAQDQVDPAYQALQSSNVFVDPNMKHVNEAQLQAAALAGPMNDGNPHTRVKIAVWRQLPSPYTDRDTYAHILGNSLQIGNDALIVVVAKKPGRGVSIVTESSALSKADANALIRQTWPEITQNETYGIADLAQKVSGKMTNNDRGKGAVLWIVFLVVILGVGGLIWSGARRRKQEMAARRGPIDALRQNVLSGIEYLDGYTDVLPKNNPDSDQMRMYRQAASTKFDQAAKIIDRATDVSDLNRAQGLLDRAQADVQQARRALDRATGGTGNIPGDDAIRVEPLPMDQSQVQQIPQNRRGVSFFSGRPAPVGALVPVTITVNGMERQVLVTPEEADELRAGRMPQVRSFQVGGRYVPWYAYDAYDPYRDYWAYENAGWGGFGNGLVAGFVAAEVLDSLTAPAFMPYAYATDNSYYQGYNDAVMNQGAFGFDGNNGGGGGWFGGGDNNNFGGNDGGNFGGDSSPYDDTAGVNFDDNSGTGDFGGFDSGGSDFGGGDFGGGDSGGGDSGGGGDF